MPASKAAPTKREIILVSNRLPLSVKRAPDGSYQSSLSSGGLVTAVSGLTKSTSFRWFGWPGIEVKDPAEREEVKRSLAAHDAVPIFLESELAHEHYNGFSSKSYTQKQKTQFSVSDQLHIDSILWPTLHYQSGVIFKDAPWTAYKKVNELIADQVSDAANDGDLVWVHDYHLMLLPKLLRERLAQKGKACAIGFSLHTPFPASDFWRTLPVGKEILEAMLSSDIIGFHTDEYKQNFTESCATVLYASILHFTLSYVT